MSNPSPELAKLYSLIDDIETALFVTRRADGSLVSRPMATQKRADGADLWFVTSSDTGKLDELAHDHQVNVSYYKDGTREWVSIAGTAAMSSDPAKIRELYEPDWKAWFGADDLPGDPRAGTPDDPRIVLIGVRATSARFMTVDAPKPVVLFELVKGMVTGKRVDIGRERTVTGEEMRRARPGAE
jgi:general stress protein 26